MPKKDSTDPIEKARKRLVKAQADLQEAQESRARVKLKGEQSVDRARHLADRQLTRATLTVEKRAIAVDDARQALEQLRRESLQPSQSTSPAMPVLQVSGDEGRSDSA